MKQSKEMTVRFKEGEKEAEINIVDFKMENQLALLDGMFKFFDIDVAFKELAQISLHTRQAYHDFFEETNQNNWTETNEEPTVDEPETNAEVSVITNFELAKQAEIADNWTVSSTQEESHWYTGIKVKGGIEHYRLHYKCPSCGKSGNQYVKKTDRRVDCYDCRTKMNVRPATDEELGRDTFGNYFVAGDFNLNVGGQYK
jgi:DNA-directed RNA polymerase subunit RPC12/RpoP